MKRARHAEEQAARQALLRRKQEEVVAAQQRVAEEVQNEARREETMIRHNTRIARGQVYITCQSITLFPFVYPRLWSYDFFPGKGGSYVLDGVTPLDYPR